MTSGRRISIILPSFKDNRIAVAIRSVRAFDDVGVTRIVVVDGGSDAHTLQVIRSELREHDLLISGPDKGIFDALNKGLEAVDTEFVGWLGSDDMFTGRVLASHVILGLTTHELFISNMAHFRGQLTSRMTYSWPACHGLVRFGFNNPHFATFGRSSLLKSERFKLGMRGSDIDYFLRIFSKRPSVLRSSLVGVLAEEGGYSSASVELVLGSNLRLVAVYAEHTNWVFAVLSVATKFLFKLGLVLGFRVMRIPASSYLINYPRPS